MRSGTALLVLLALAGCATPEEEGLQALEKACAEGRKVACDVIPIQQEQVNQARQDRMAAFGAALAAGAAQAASQPTYIPPPVVDRRPVSTTCQQNGQYTYCNSY